MSQLRNTALATGVDFETLGRAFAQFGPRMTEALASPASRGSQALRALGVDVRDTSGNIRQLDELLPELADKFAGFANGSNKAAISAALFSEEAGPKMLALLNKGSAGLEEIRRKLGSTFTEADAETVRNYNRAMAELQVAFERAILPSLTKAAELMTRLSRLPSTISGLASATSAEAAGVQARIELLNKELERHRKLNDEGRETDERFAQVQARITEELEKQTQRLRELNRERDRNSIGPFQTTTTPNLPQAPAMDPFALEKAQIILEQMMERLSGQRDLFDCINLSWQEHGELVQRTIAQIDKAHDSAHRREAARHRFEMGLRRQEQQAMLDTATLAAQTITALWPKQKGAAIAAAIINTAVGVTKALSSAPPPWNFIQAALVGAAGAAQIASIRSTNEDGAGGGSTGVAAAPAEPVVDQGRALTINGVDPGALFSGGQVRNLIDLINDEVKNGATLISSGRLSA